MIEWRRERFIPLFNDHSSFIFSSVRRMFSLNGLFFISLHSSSHYWIRCTIWWVRLQLIIHSNNSSFSSVVQLIVLQSKLIDYQQFSIDSSIKQPMIRDFDPCKSMIWPIELFSMDTVVEEWLISHVVLLSRSPPFSLFLSLFIVCLTTWDKTCFLHQSIIWFEKGWNRRKGGKGRRERWVREGEALQFPPYEIQCNCTKKVNDRYSLILFIPGTVAVQSM